MHRFMNRYGLFPTYEYIIYTLTITVNCQGNVATFVVTNQEEAPNAINKKKIKKINIYRDCFTEGTEILLSDGTKKRAEDLKKGDRLKSQDGRNAEIVGGSGAVYEPAGRIPAGKGG